MAIRHKLIVLISFFIILTSCTTTPNVEPWPFKPPLWIQGSWVGTYHDDIDLSATDTICYKFYSIGIERLLVVQGGDGKQRKYTDKSECVINWERFWNRFNESSSESVYIISAVIARGNQVLFDVFKKESVNRIALYEYISNEPGRFKQEQHNAENKGRFICYLDRVF